MANRRNQSDNGHSPADPIEEAQRTGGIPRGKRRNFIISFILVVITASSADVLIKYSVSGDRAFTVNSLSEIPDAALHMLTNVWLILAIVLILIQFVTFAQALRLGPLSFVVPMRGACTYVATALLAQAFLGEEVTLERWGAIVVILVGVTIIGLTGGED
jgi:drug/metabolite transporter (DMT)-like permease